MCTRPLIATVCAAAIAFAASSASAYEPQSNSVAKEKQGQEQQKKVCRWLPVTGSNMNQKVCLTPEDWKKAESLSW